MKERGLLCNGDVSRAIRDGRQTQDRRPARGIGGRKFGGFVIESTNSKRLRNDAIFYRGDSVTMGYDYAYSRSPFGKPGDRLYVRETWADVNTEEGPAICYRADSGVRTWHNFSESFGPDYGAGPSMDYDAYPGDYAMWWSDLLNKEPGHKWHPSIHMPKWAARTWLEVLRVWVERIQDISEEDAGAEGATCDAVLEYDGLASGAVDYTGLYSSDRFFEAWNSIYEKKGYGSHLNPYVWACEFKVVEHV